MRCVGVLYAFFLSIAAVVGSGEQVFADPSDPLTDLLPVSQLSGGATPEKFLYFSGFDLWREGLSAYGGMQWSPGGLNQDGFTFKLLLAESGYRYNAGATRIRGTGLLASFLSGWRTKINDVEIRVFVGLDLQYHRLSPVDPGNDLRGTHAGTRISAELWWEPLRDTMVSASASGSTIGDSFDARAAAGWRLWDQFWTGPEASVYGDDVYRQYRVGAHVTSLRFATFEWSLGLGYVQDNSHHSGLYGRIGLLARQ